MPPSRRYLDKPRPFGCPHPGCDAHFEKPVHLRRHQISHSQEPYLECSACHATFGRIDSFQRHVKRKHEGERETPAALPVREASSERPSSSTLSTSPTAPPTQPSASSDQNPPLDLDFGALEAGGDAGPPSFDALVDQVFADYLFGFDVVAPDPPTPKRTEPAPVEQPAVDAGPSSSVEAAPLPGLPLQPSTAPDQVEMQTRELVVRGVTCPPMPGGLNAPQLATLAIKRLSDVLPIVPPYWIARIGDLSTQRPLVFVALVTMATLWSHSLDVRAYGKLLWRHLVFRVAWSSSVFLLEQPQKLKEITLTMTMGNCFAFMAQDRQTYLHAVHAALTGASMTKDFARHAKAAVGCRSSLDQARDVLGIDESALIAAAAAATTLDQQLPRPLWTAWLEAEELNRALVIGCLHDVHMESYIEEDPRPRLAGTLLDCPMPQPLSLWDAQGAQEWAQSLARHLQDPAWSQSARCSLRQISRAFFGDDVDAQYRRRELFASLVEPQDGFALSVIMEAIGAWAWQSSSSARGWSNWESGGDPPSPHLIPAALDRLAESCSSPSLHPAGSVQIRWHALQLFLLVDLAHCRLGLHALEHNLGPAGAHDRPCRAPTGLCPFSDPPLQRRAAYHAGSILAWFLDLPRSQTITFPLACAVCHAFSTLALFALAWPRDVSISPSSVELCESRPMSASNALPAALRTWIEAGDSTQPFATLLGRPLPEWPSALLEVHPKLVDVEQGWIEAPVILGRCKNLLDERGS